MNEVVSGQLLMDRIRSLVRRFALLERADVACCDMTVAQAATLEVLLREGDLRLGTLGQRLGISNSTMTRNLDRLKRRGLVKTEPDPTDRRVAIAVLTDEGRRAADRVTQIEAEFARSIAESLGELGARETIDVLDRLLIVVRTASEGCCPGAYDHLLTPIQLTQRRFEDHGDQR